MHLPTTKRLTRREQTILDGKVAPTDLTGNEAKGVLERAYSSRDMRGLDIVLGKMTARRDFSSLKEFAEGLKATREADGAKRRIAFAQS